MIKQGNDVYYSESGSGYVIRIEVGEEIQESLRQFAACRNLKGAFFQGIGTLTQVELAHFSSVMKTYQRQFFEEEYELVTLLGNLSADNGSLVPHSHVVLSDRNFHTISGHLVRGTVSATAEILLVPIDISLEREEDPFLKYYGLVSQNRMRLTIRS